MVKNDISAENTLLLAVHRHCLHYMSGDKELVDNCRAGPYSGLSMCALWEYRQGPLSKENHAKKFVLATIHQHCIQCIGKESEVDKCQTNETCGYRKCLLYGYRNGNRRL